MIAIEIIGALLPIYTFVTFGTSSKHGKIGTLTTFCTLYRTGKAVKFTVNRIALADLESTLFN